MDMPEFVGKPCYHLELGRYAKWSRGWNQNPDGQSKGIQQHRDRRSSQENRAGTPSKPGMREGMQMGRKVISMSRKAWRFPKTCHTESEWLV